MTEKIDGEFELEEKPKMEGKESGEDVVVDEERSEIGELTDRILAEIGEVDEVESGEHKGVRLLDKTGNEEMREYHLRKLGREEKGEFFCLREKVREIHDQEWCPPEVRNLLRQSLEAGIMEQKVYAVVADMLVGLMKKMGADSILDLCSGAGGPWAHLEQAIASKVSEFRVKLSDAFPVDSRILELDAMHPPEVPKVRTMFTALHHFRPDEVVGILNKAIEDGAAFAAFEMTERSMLGLVASPIVGFVSTWKYWIKNGKLKDFPTALVTSFVHAWDGFVSSLNTYTRDELSNLVKLASGAENYSWDVGKMEQQVGLIKFPITYITGVPKDKLVGA